MAQRLKKLGFNNITNLNGSIFSWAAEGYPLEGSDKIHLYNEVDRQMLRDDLESN